MKVNFVARSIYTVLSKLENNTRVCHVRVLCRNGSRHGHSCYGMRTGNLTHDFEWYHF